MKEYKTTLENYLANLQEKVGRSNSELLIQFVEKFKATPSEPGDHRIYTVLIRLTAICKMIDKPLDNLTEEDLIKFNNTMRDRGMQSSLYYRRTLKQFLRLLDKKKYFDLIDSDFLKSPKKKNGSKRLVDPHEFWNEEQISEYIKESQKFSERQACWAGLWLSTGCRPHELLSLEAKNITRQNNLLVINVTSGKTGSRTI
ncbi:MAG: hypothetical protein CL944_01080, partial [Candidatus Diapherotrites archaeon]|nr:hypothetical protein [Candidatus Diapherotrites archaeon]